MRVCKTVDKMDIVEDFLVKVYVTASAFTAESVRPFLENEPMGDTDLFEIETLYGCTSQEVC